MNNTGLTQDDIKKINSVFTQHLEIEKVILYDSHALGTYKPASDIDQSLVGKQINLSLIN